ncbi:MAG: DUF3352 domain-containing protein [Nostoc sp. ChiSLP02]|nr:DUF3352 domain-containing protein [Nostoc sp. DedSLP05]MDZ8101071.1 DUF3352 domain-containing protein [Nostoc sp. DedSLP01]MDZ8188964.1 DUF3352 domain-containing protein [Nostoc sp. ChiSLP02]
MNRQRSFIGFIVAGAIAVLAIAIAGFYWFFPKSPANLIAPTSQPGATIFISKLAPVMASLLTNPDRLQALERDGEISKLQTSFLAKSGIDYQQDVQSWLGNEISLAVTTLDIDRDPENGQQPGYLLALATKQPEKSREFVELLFSKRALAGANLNVEEYKGIKVIHDNQEPIVENKTQIPKSQIEDNLAGAVVGENFVLFANDPKVLKDAINNIQAPDLNLTSSPQYQKAIKQLPKGSLAVAFLNLPIVAKWQGLELPEQLSYDSEIISLVLNSKGLLAETAFLSSSEIASPSPTLTKPVGALQYLPASAGLAISGSNLSNLGNSNLAKLWKQVTATIYGSKEDVVSQFAKPLGDTQKSWGINLPEDIFSWVQGEYAIALLPEEETNPHWIFVVEKSESVEQGVARLDAIASSNGLTISPLTIDNQKISAWTELTTASKKNNDKDGVSFNIETKVRGAHTTLGNYEVFTSDLETMDKVITAKDNSLINNPKFQDSIAAIPRPNQGYIYFDWTKSQNLLERQIPILKLVEVLGKPFFNNLRSLTVSSYGTDTEALKGGVFLQLNKS